MNLNQCEKHRSIANTVDVDLKNEDLSKLMKVTIATPQNEHNGIRLIYSMTQEPPKNGEKYAKLNNGFYFVRTTRSDEKIRFTELNMAAICRVMLYMIALNYTPKSSVYEMFYFPETFEMTRLFFESNMNNVDDDTIESNETDEQNEVIDDTVELNEPDEQNEVIDHQNSMDDDNNIVTKHLFRFRDDFSIIDFCNTLDHLFGIGFSLIARRPIYKIWLQWLEKLRYRQVCSLKMPTTEDFKIFYIFMNVTSTVLSQTAQLLTFNDLDGRIYLQNRIKKLN